MKITSHFLFVISRARIGCHLLNADLCIHIAANPDTGQIRILKTTSSNRTFGSHLKCRFVRLHWFYRTERSDFTETSVQCERGLTLYCTQLIQASRCFSPSLVWQGSASRIKFLVPWSFKIHSQCQLITLQVKNVNSLI